MKNVQKLEMFFGLATFVATIISINYLGLLSHTKQDNDSIMIETILFHIIPALLTAISSIAHTFTRSMVAFILLILGSSVLVFFFGLPLITFVTFYYYGWIIGFLVTTPGIFAALTMYFAFRTRKSFALPN